ncbi:hypothetical protein [Paraburkholderia sp. LEh10]|uniref:hypothetical protein n=1 Tax=Paraburkholderia sp. LEh10 TaxID=2821353 RepID=UPI001FD7E66C|nr:hypothetical protein [Paraburkholderia sp. LEh10]
MENIMEGMDRIRVSAGPVPLGRLEELQSFDERPELARGLPGNIPVLTFPLRLSEAQCLSRNYRGYHFGFGHVETGDGMLLTMRLQLETLQFYWIAQMTDPELWAAIDMWRQEQRIPIGLKIQSGKAWDISFLFLDVPLPTPLTAEKHRCAPQRVVTPHDWKCMAALTGGLMQIQATSDIPGIPLEHVFASALLTQQFEGVAGKEPLIKMPMVIKAPHQRHIDV